MRRVEVSSSPGPSPFSHSPECVENRNSRKFTVASDPPISAPGTPEELSCPASEPKHRDQVAFVAPLGSKVLRLVTAQLPEKYSPGGPGLNRTSP